MTGARGVGEASFSIEMEKRHLCALPGGKAYIIIGALQARRSE
jgi:hypothetical protein